MCLTSKMILNKIIYKITQAISSRFLMHVYHNHSVYVHTQKERIRRAHELHFWKSKASDRADSTLPHLSSKPNY